MDGELVMINGGTGKFFSLKDVGLQIWNLLDEASDLDEICLQLEQLYSVDPQACRESVTKFAGQLVEAGFAEEF